MIDLDAMFEGRLRPPWFDEFAAAPVEALEALLAGYADLGTLSAEEPLNLLRDWLERFGATGGFTPAVDAALAAWVERSWRQPVLPTARGSVSLTALAWVRAANIIGLQPGLVQASASLRSRVLADAAYLDGLQEGRTRDPLGRAWWAIARHQTDRSLASQWWRLCDLPPDEPWHRGVYGLEGLRCAPALPEESGGFRFEVARGLLRLGVSLHRRQAGRLLDAELARREFLRTARLTMAAYPFPDTWQTFWRRALRPREEPLREWTRELVPPEPEREHPGAGRRRTPLGLTPAADWSVRATDLGQALRAHQTWAIAEAEALLEAQVRYAEGTGDTDFAVRSACNFAAHSRDWRPADAERWARLARQLDPWNPYTWSEEFQALSRLGNHADATRLAVQAAQRFPNDVFIRTGLAGILRAAGRLSEAAAVYRETVRQFPGNAVARGGLETSLAALAALEAEGVQETGAASGTPGEPGDLTVEDIQTLLTDAYLLRTWARGVGEAGSLEMLRVQAARVLERLEAYLEEDGLAAGEAGLLLLDLDEVARAVELLERADKRFPGNPRLLYALARAHRVISRREERAYGADTLAALVRPLKAVQQRNEQIRPLRLLAEGRAYDALRDGEVVDQGIRDALGSLGRWISLQIAPLGQAPLEELDTGEPDIFGRFARLPEAEKFSAWWASQVQELVFGDQLVASANELTDVATVRQRLRDNEAVLDLTEEQYLLRCTT